MKSSNTKSSIRPTHKNCFVLHHNAQRHTTVLTLLLRDDFEEKLDHTPTVLILCLQIQYFLKLNDFFWRKINDKLKEIS